MQPEIVVVGAGFAGLSTGLNLLDVGFEKVKIVSVGSGSSAVSPSNILRAEPKQLKRMLLKVGRRRNSGEIVDEFIGNISYGYSFFAEQGIECRLSNIGFVPKGKRPGQESCKALWKRFAQNGGNVTKQTVDGFLVGDDKVIGLVSGSRKTFGDVFVLAFGGLGNLYSYSTGPATDYNLMGLCLEAGFVLENLEFNMFHPFLVVDKKLPRTLVSGEILQHMHFVDEQGKEFLSKEVKNALSENRHHTLFDSMTREFYLQSRKSKLFAVIELNEREFAEFVEENEFGQVFRGKELIEIRKFEIRPAFHYSLGGLKVDKKGRTCFENVFALGECSTGLHGASRIGGTSVLECTIFGKVVANEIKNSGFGYSKKKSGRKRVVPRITKRQREMFWQCLGPVKSQQKLQEISGRDYENPYMKLLQQAAKSSLKTGCLGTNFVE